MKNGKLGLCLGLIITGFVASAAWADQMATITVEATHNTTQKGAMGREMPAVALSYRVSYADLDISTSSGAKELEKRVNKAAHEACAQIAKLYPETTEGNPPCVEGAIKNAMVQANAAIAAAEKGAQR